MQYIKISKVSIQRDFSGIDREFRRTINEIFSRVNPLFNLGQHAWLPHTDIYETEEEITVTSELAGVRIEDIHVESDQRTLKIYGIRRERAHPEEGRYLLAEIPSGYFERFITLPSPIDLESVTASYSDGLLSIRMRKLIKEESRTISVRNV